MKATAVPFKRSLLINLTIGVASLGLIMLAISLLATQQTVASLSETLTDQVISTTDAQIMRFFEPIMAEIEIAAERTRDGEFEAFPLTELDGYFEPLIAEMPQISSIMYSHGNGDEYMLLQSGDRWSSRLSQPESRGDIVSVRTWMNGEANRQAVDQNLDYDSRNRPWFTGALDNFTRLGEQAPLRERIHWTTPYRFFTTGEPGITASLAYRSASGRLVVLGFDVLLGDISRYTSQLRIAERGLVFVLRGSPAQPEGLAIVGLPADGRFDTSETMLEFVLSPPGDFGGPVASFVQDALTTRGERPGEAVRFLHEGEPWWGEIAASRLRVSDDIWVGAVVPEKDLLAGLPNTNLIIIVVTAVVLLFAVGRGFRLAHRYSAPVEALTQQGIRMQRLNFEPGHAVESDITEIRHLSSTLERMRSALQSFTSSREDLRIASSIRDKTLPAVIPTPPGFEIDLWHSAAEELGGESYEATVIRTDGDGQPQEVLAGVFDLPATGLGAALGGVQLGTEFRVAAATEGGDLTAIAARLGRFVEQEGTQLSPLRCCLIRIETGGNLSLLGFGWNEILIQQDDRVQRLALGETPLGVAAANYSRAPEQIHLEPGDLLLLASDGILDALSDSRQRYGLDGLQKALLGSNIREPGVLTDRVINDLEGFKAGIRGDRTLAVIRCTDNRPANS